VNDAFAALAGRRRDEVSGKRLADLLPGAAPALLEAFEETLRDGVPRYRIPVVLDAGGESRRADFTLYRTRGSHGEVGAGHRVVALVRDLGTLPEAEPAEREARQRPEVTAQQLARLQEVTAALSAAVSEAEVAEVVFGAGLHVLGASGGSLCFPVAGVLKVAHASGSMAGVADDGAPPPALRASLEEAFLREEPVWIASAEELRRRYPALARGDAPISDAAWAALPLRVRGRSVGVLGIGFAGAHPFGAEERGFVEALTHQAAQAVDRARLYEEQRQLRVQAEEAAATRELLVRELRRTLRERDESAAILDALFGNAPVGLSLLDRDMRYLRMNEYLARLHEAPAEAMIGRSPWESLPPLAREDVVRDFQRVVAGEAPIVERTVVAPPRIPGDSQRTFTVVFFPVSVAGRLIGVGSLVQEVTRQQVAEQSRRHVLGVVGHDLRSPLMAITASAELLQAGPLDERAARSVGRILRASSRIDGIIRALVDYTMVQGGPGIALHPRRTDLSVLVRSVCEECEAAHAGRIVRVNAPEPVQGEWDGDRLGQAVANLVGNALQYSPEDSAVEVGCWREGQDAVVDVTNAGPPIPPELVPHLFEPFRRGNDERSQRRKGLGLGLYIAVQIAAAHGGTIRVRSDADRGTTFSVRLPAKGGASRERGQPT
jgi:PAS domain S-box-containing protein